MRRGGRTEANVSGAGYPQDGLFDRSRRKLGTRSSVPPSLTPPPTSRYTCRPRRSISSRCWCSNGLSRSPRVTSITACGRRRSCRTGSLAVLVAEIRSVLGDNVRQPLFVRTLHRFGYAFVSQATGIEDHIAVQHPRWNARRLVSVLCPGYGCSHTISFTISNSLAPTRIAFTFEDVIVQNWPPLRVFGALQPVAFHDRIDGQGRPIVYAESAAQLLAQPIEFLQRHIALSNNREEQRRAESPSAMQ